jgi:pimeloyl-ACP methyl ester carboxylesterase
LAAVFNEACKGEGMGAAMKRAFGDIAEGQVHYWHGGAGGPRPLIYLHPGPGTARHQVPLSTALAANRRVIAPDILGMGDSVAPLDRIARPGVDYFADAMFRFLDGLGVDQVDLFGSSLGGRICVEMARTRPERVKHLVLNRVLVLKGEDLEAMKKNQGPEVKPDPHGMYIWFVWTRMRNLYQNFPWFKTTAANLRKADLPPAELLHLSFVEHIKMCPTSHKAFTAYYDYPTADMLPRLMVKTMARPDTARLIPGAVEWTPCFDGDSMQAKPEDLAALAAQISVFLET